MSKETTLIPIETIENKIYLIRGQKVILDKDLAILYGVKTFVLNQAVKRNLSRFPEDFMFSLSRSEILRISQIVISSPSPNHSSLKYSKNVNAFTENGVAMLSSVLRSEKAIQVNIQIIRIFTKLRQILIRNKELARKFDLLEHKVEKLDSDIQLIFQSISKLLEPPKVKPKRIGFLVDREEEAIE